jgi:Cu(I)/Ag(I) efflux system membrane fusion protein
MMHVLAAAPAGTDSRQRPFSNADRELQRKLLAAYFQLQRALASDQLEAARTAAAKLRAAAGAQADIDPARTADSEWSSIVARVKAESDAIARAPDIAAARKHFEPLSLSLVRSVHTFGVPGETALHLYHCPMAFNNRGADWLQDKSGLLNPYFGAEMLTCGSLKETLEPPTSKRGN